jgi:hypothetical protein
MKIKLQADNINGVYQVESFEGEILSQENFYTSLKDNPDDSVICAEVDKEMALKIQEEYGIH